MLYSYTLVIFPIISHYDWYCKPVKIQKIYPHSQMLHGIFTNIYPNNLSLSFVIFFIPAPWVAYGIYIYINILIPLNFSIIFHNIEIFPTSYLPFRSTDLFRGPDLPPSQGRRRNGPRQCWPQMVQGTQYFPHLSRRVLAAKRRMHIGGWM